MLSPSDIKNKTFSRAMRGYNMEEVDKYIGFVGEKYAELYRENRELEHKLKAALEKAESATKNEDEIRGTLLTAKKAGDKIVRDATEQAEVLYSTAKSNTDRVLRDFRRQIATEALTLEKLKKCVAEMKANLYRQYRENLEQIETLAPFSRYEKSLLNPDTQKYLDEVIEGMKKDIAEGEERAELQRLQEENSGIKIRRTPQNTLSNHFRIASIKDTIKELNQQILAADADLGEPGTLVQRDFSAPPQGKGRKKRAGAPLHEHTDAPAAEDAAGETTAQDETK